MWRLSPDRCFDPDPAQRDMVRQLYATVKDLPLVCPHGHVSPALLADPDACLGSPADLFIIPGHYVFRMLDSQGIRMEDLGVPTQDGTAVETDHRRIWQRFAEHFLLFRGTPTGLWLADELVNLFGVQEPLNGDSAQRIYDHLEAQLARPEFAPRALLERLKIELLASTDAATDTLEHHRRLRADGLTHIRPTFRQDAVVNITIRELAPLAGHYPAVLLGPPWWFFESVNGMRRYFDRVIETAGLVVLGLIAEDDAAEMAYDCAYGLAKRAYRVPP
jgi:glucuronate isomerase